MANDKAVMAVIRAARPSFRNNHDKVSFAVHSSFLAAGYVLIATGRPAFAGDALYSTSLDEVGIDGWNEFDGEYAFVYTYPDKGSVKVIVKCLAMGDKLLVDAIADGGNVPAHLAIDVGDYVGENGDGNYSAQFKNLEKLVGDLQKEVLNKLHPEAKPSSSDSRSFSLERNEERRGIREPGSGIPDPYGPQIDPSGAIIPPIPSGGGFSDLFPGPGAGAYPHRGGFGDGSMLVGPGDPRFFGPFGDRPDFPGAQPGIPPGARFDPYGPPGVPGFEPGRFIRQPPRRGPGNGTHPDLEHFPGGSDFI
ncbi:PREDICTED: probable proteasome inhibitor [Tarenaya hassleriana]|uniref:probable proteasome inhibitor n=1 Tax=Tarenaya hassleriana TaxID=28532 RepID=UPI00053C35F6|nr:PREDICTED: probable proteasome inhibitor [Tarenaya hassleriana]